MKGITGVFCLMHLFFYLFEKHTSFHLERVLHTTYMECHDAQHNNTQHNDIQLNDTQHNDIQLSDSQHSDIQLNDTQRKGLIRDTV
jgi:hypothetical protein